ncbi:UDP-N-acetyl-D-mannosamine dehydrogenase [Psychrosphaera ytuae]|nr:UDP-N-acetyl-D-mannosamine dehydrogenase [Psychrosphaera ytuae]
MFASRKKKVVGVDVNQQAVDTINRGEIHIVEPDLDDLVHSAVTNGFLSATTTPQASDAFLIAVPTPFKDSNNNQKEIPVPDLKYIKEAATAIAPVLKKGDLVILESTSPVGATEQMAEWLKEIRKDLSFPQDNNDSPDINIAHCPERVLPGHVVRELVENDRVIGGMTEMCSLRAVDLYKTFVEGECVVTNARTAEMAKLTENSCRDVQIAFANELSVICDKLDINVWELISLANRHPRINILQPGPGVGGHCIAVDPWFIVSKTPNEAQLIHTARKVNDSKPNWVVDKVKQKIAEFLIANPNKRASEVTIGCFGLAFKPDIDDLRESPALNIAEEIANFHPGRVIGIEPNIKKLSTSSPLELASIDTGITKSDIALILVNHKEFYTVNFQSLEFLIDTKGMVN